jgi:GT2 family glycosyltransferase
MSVLHVSWPRRTQVEVISGACILARRDCFERVGGFTESYFMYGEDLDLCFKLCRSGAPAYHVPETRIVHHRAGSMEKATSDFSTIMIRESVLRFMRFNRGLIPALIYRMSMLVTALVRLAVMGPMMLLGNRVVRHGAGSWRKWFTILCWSLGLDAFLRARTPFIAVPVLASTRTN